MKIASRLLFPVSILAALSVAQAQDSVDVTFRYQAATTQNWALVGEFTNWATGALPMTPIGNNIYVRIARLALTGGVYTPGAYEYKFYYSGIGIWPNDPLNPRSDPNQNGNSILYVRNPTIYQLLPNQVSGLVLIANPLISAYLFPKVGSTIDTSSLALQVDATTYRSLGTFYDTLAQQFRFTLPNALSNGTHRLWLTAGANSDSTSFTVQAGFVQITNLSNFVTRNSQRTLYGTVEDTSIHTVTVVRNAKDSIAAAVTAGNFSLTFVLVEGINSFRAFVRDSTSSIRGSDSVIFNHFVNHAPDAEVIYEDFGSSMLISGSQSTDPDPGQTDSLKYQWSSDTANPQVLNGLDGMTNRDVTISKPTTPGDYYVSLVVTDPNGNKDTTRSFFTLNPNGTVYAAGWASIPQWARNGRIYSLFFKSLTPQGTINAALPYLPYIKNMGFNILWVLPVMRNASPINSGSGPGYNIVDFYTVAPEYGTNADFKNFVQQAHQLGLKVMLDVTPNHTSYMHPFAQEGKMFRLNSPHWSFYQHQPIVATLGDGGVGPQLPDADGFIYYSGFSSQLLNYNWADIDARWYMTNVYRSWIANFGLDGYRFDVYWGPHNRTNNGAGGESEMGVPVRTALKHIKPDIIILGETAGTGSGTEVNYADDGGGVDAAYDWNLKGAVQGFTFTSTSIDSLNAAIYNSGYYPGPNSSFLRFLENQDEDRIAYVYNSYQKTMPMATAIFTSPGIPMVWAGEEVGIGYGMSSQGLDYRRRAVIDWNYGGKSLLTPHYQRLAQTRAQFPAFSTHIFTRINSGNALVYSYVRPYAGQDGIVAVNFGSSDANVTLSLSSSVLGTSIQTGKTYYASDLYKDTTYDFQFIGGNTSLQINLPAYGSAIFVLSDSSKRLILPSITSVPTNEKSSNLPSSFGLSQNYPNPFNPTTNITYSLPQQSKVRLRVYNILGQMVMELFNGLQNSGNHVVTFDASRLAGGVYFYRLEAGTYVNVKKMILLK